MYIYINYGWDLNDFRIEKITLNNFIRQYTIILFIYLPF